MSGKKDCGGTNDSLKEHLKECCAYGQRPALIEKCAAGTTSPGEKPYCLGPSPPPSCCPTPKPTPCPPPFPTCDVPPTTTFSCPCPPPPPPPPPVPECPSPPEKKC